jgi:hypothetical protein
MAKPEYDYAAMRALCQAALYRHEHSAAKALLKYVTVILPARSNAGFRFPRV